MQSCDKKTPDNYDPNVVILKYDESFNGISEETARTMAQGYRSAQLRVINDGLKIDDSRYIWYDLESLKHFIWQIEHSANVVYGKEKHPKLGIKVFYGTFPADMEGDKYLDLKGVPTEYQRKHNLFFVPTFAEGDDKNNYEFNPIQNIRESGADSLMHNFKKLDKSLDNLDNSIGYNNRKKTERKTTNSGTTLMLAAAPPPYTGDNYIYDHGSLCPTNCGNN